MPSWKKVIVSGSDATLNSVTAINGLTVTGSTNLSGSLIVSGSTTLVGSSGNLFTANVDTLTFTGSVNISGSTVQTGSISATSFTGSLFGTASWANNVISASYAATASTSQDARDILVYVKNSSGAQINKGTVVRITGAVGDNPLIATASYTDDNNSANTLGITYETIANDSFGYVITEGTLIGIDTSTPGWTAGQLIYLGATGSITGSAPVAPLHAVRLGEVLRVQLNNGSIYVRIDNGYELGELHDVRDTTTTGSYGDLLVKSGSIWINSKQLTGSYGLTGSLTSTNGGFTGSLQGTASWANNATTASFASTIANGLNITASSIYINNNLTVNGTASFNYVQTVTGSAIIIGQEYIVLNTQIPAARFAGLQIYDSGSASTASLVWDSQTDHFIYSKASGSSYSGGMFIAGPKNTGSLGQEQTLTQWRVPVAQGDDHIMDSQIYSSGSITIVTGSLQATLGFTGSLQGTASWANNATTASYALNATSASYSNNSTSASYALNATSASYATNAGTAQTASYVLNAVSASYASASTSASYAQNATSASYALNSTSASYALNATSASYALNATSASYASASTSASYASASTSASYSQNATSASYSLNSTSASYALNSTSASYTLNATSASYASGSTSASYASSSTSASYAVNTTSASYATNAGTAQTASYVLNAVSASYASSSTSASYALNATSASYALNSTTASYALAATSASYASASTSASYALNSTSASYALNATSASYALSSTSASYASSSTSASYASASTSASYAQNATSASYSLNSTSASYALNATSASYSLNSTSASYALTSTSASYASASTSASYALNATSASYALNSTSASYALNATNATNASTASSADNFTVRGTLTAQTIVVQTITSSISVVTGSFVVSGSLTALNGVTGSLLGTASWAVSASHALNATSASYSLNSTSASYALNATTASYSLNTTSASYALTASHALSLKGISNNYIPVGNTAGDVSNSVMYQTNSNIGIGTTTVTSQLTLYKAAGNSLLQLTNADEPGFSLKFHNSGSTSSGAKTFTQFLDYNGSMNGYMAFHRGSSGTDGYLSFGDNGGERVRFANGGNVGIGSTSPSYLLDIVSSAGGAFATVRVNNGYTGASDGSQLLLGNSANFTNAYFRLNGGGNSSQAGAGSLNIGVTQAVDMAFYTSNTERIRIQSDGNVGIGYTSPAVKLDVAGIIATRISAFTYSTIDGASDGNLYITANAGQANTTTSNTIFRYSTSGGGITESMRISNVGNVGIGTTSPAYKLHVSGTAFASTVSGNYITDGYITLGLGDLLFAGDGGGSGFQMDYYSGQMYFGNNAGSTWHMVIQDGGNVGIGTTSPETKLHIAGGDVLISNGQYYSIESTTGGNYKVAGLTSGNLVVIGAIDYTSAGTIFAGGDNVSITTGGVAGTSRMYINSGGNVGVGTTSPSEKVDINGKVKVGTRLAMTPSVFGYSSAWKTLILGSTGSDYNTDAVTITFGVDLSSNANGGYTGNGGEIFFRNNTTFGTPNEDNTGYRYPMQFNSGSIYLVSAFGNVGIATTSATLAKLQVNGNVWATSFTGSFSGSITAPGSNTNIIYNSSGVLAGSNDFVYDGTDVGIGTTAPAPYINSGAAKGIQISNNGRAGLRFHDTSGVVQYFDIGAHSGYAYISAIYSQTPSIRYQAYSNHIFENNDTGSLYITSANRVGIGTASPGAKLQIAGGSLDTGALYDLGLSSALTSGRLGTFDAGSLASISTRGDASSVELAAGTSANYYSGISATANNASLFAGTLRFVTSGSERMRITSDGTLMVGTTSQTYNNSTYGYAASFKGAVTTQAYISVALSNQTSTSQGMLFGLTSTTGDIYVLDNKPLVFYTNGTAKMRIAADGNVGIGTTIPTDKLSVGGNVGLTSGGYLGFYRYSGATHTFTTDGFTSATFGVSSGVFTGRSDAGLTISGYDQLRLYTEDVERMRITRDGNVGIGTTSPISPLQVGGQARIAYSKASGSNPLDVDGYTGIVIVNTTGSGANNSLAGIGMYGNSQYRAAAGLFVTQEGEYSGSMVFYTGNALATEKMRIRYDGNVGINTASPSYKFHVKSGASNSYFSYFEPSAGSGFLAIYQDTNNHLSLYGANASGTTNVVINTNGVSYLKGGNVIIGGSADNSNTLQVQGTGYFSGNVGIGSTSPAYTLDVNGTGRFTAIIETSTRTLKSNIESYSTDIDKFKQLEPVSFTWKDTSKQDVGLIAEDVEQIFPEFVSKTDEGDVTGINYGKLSTIFINVLKQQQQKIEELEDKIKKLTS